MFKFDICILFDYFRKNLLYFCGASLFQILFSNKPKSSKKPELQWIKKDYKSVSQIQKTVTDLPRNLVAVLKSLNRAFFPKIGHEDHSGRRRAVQRCLVVRRQSKGRNHPCGFFLQFESLIQFLFNQAD